MIGIMNEPRYDARKLCQGVGRYAKRVVVQVGCNLIVGRILA